MATFGYGRVSTRDQDVQNKRLEIEHAGFTLDDWYADEGVSGKSRPRSARNSASCWTRYGTTSAWWSPNSTGSDGTPWTLAQRSNCW